MDNFQRTVCLFHKDCFDGLGAAWVVSLSYPDALFIPVRYGSAIPDEVNGCDVIIVDFSYPYEIMVGLMGRSKSLTIIDHHDSAKDTINTMFEQFPDRVKGLFNISRSGAALAWQYFQGKDRPVPLFIQYIEDRDLFRFKFADTHEFIETLGTVPLDLETWKGAFDHVIDMDEAEETLFMQSFISLGQVLLKRKKNDIEQTIQQTLRFHDFFGFEKIPLINVSRALASDALAVLAKDYPFAIGYYDDATHRNFSIRGRKDCGLKLNTYAESMGGGGHPLACGFRVPRNHPLAQI